jgi:hypothetical protein
VLDGAGDAMPSSAAGAMSNNVRVNEDRRGLEIAIGGLVKVKAGSGAWTYRMQDTLVRPNEEKISQKFVRRGLIELSTISNSSTAPGLR